MTKARMLAIVAVVLSAAARLALCAPVVKGVALCRQPPPGKTEAYEHLTNLVLVALPGGNPVRLFLKTPAAIPPTTGSCSAWLLDGGRLVLLYLHYASGNKDGYLLLVNPATGKLSIITDDAAGDYVLISPDKKTVLYHDRGIKRINVWHTNGRKTRATTPRGWEGGEYEWTLRMPHPCVTYSRIGSEKKAKFWLDEDRGTVTPIAPGDPWTKALDVCNGKYAYADKNWDLWLIGPGRKKAKLARLEVEGEPPENIWCRFSPDGEYVVCSCGRSAGEPHITYARATYYFGLHGAKPVKLSQPQDSDEVYVPDIVSWCSPESGILHTYIGDLLWTDLPSLKTRKIATLPDNCTFLDFVRRDEPSPRGKRN